MRLISSQSFVHVVRPIALALLAVNIQLAAWSTDALAAQGGVAMSVPFKGSFRAIESYDYQFPTLFLEATGGGNATHLGRFTMTYDSKVDLTVLAGSGSAHFVAANGDNLYAEVTGQAYPTNDPNVVSIVEVFTIAGGTGRFQGATGSVTVMRLLNTVTGVTAGSFRGRIVKP